MVGRMGDVPATGGSCILGGGLPPGPVQGKGGETQWMCAGRGGAGGGKTETRHMG